MYAPDLGVLRTEETNGKVWLVFFLSFTNQSYFYVNSTCDVSKSLGSKLQVNCIVIHSVACVIMYSSVDNQRSELHN